MTKKVYRTAQGQVVDLGELLLKNEEVRAVGNMGVNARGDIIDSQNRQVESRSKVVQKSYSRQTNVMDEPVLSRAPKKIDTVATVKEKTEVEVEGQDTADTPVEEASVVETKSTESGGLAAAIARAREVKQTPLKTPREIAQEQSGVKKI
jgi:hypothetical protein